jgi:hypothetical protein
VTVKAPLAGAAEEWAEEEARELDLEEEGWVVPDRAPARQGSVCAHNAALQPLIKSGYPVTRYSARSVAQPWSEDNTR